MKKQKVLFLCTGNSCRSQMAETLLRHVADDTFEVFSAGMDPREEIHPMSVQVMKEIGIDISNQKPKSLREFLGKHAFSHMFVVCDKAQQTCPRIWPGLSDKNRHYWPFDDPAHAEGNYEEKLAVFRRVRNEIKEKLDEWLKEQKINTEK